MSSPLRQTGTQFRQRRDLLGLLLLANLLLALVLTFALWLSYRNFRTTTDERAQNTAIALERGLSGMLSQIDQALVGGKFLLERGLDEGRIDVDTLDAYIKSTAPTVNGLGAYRYSDAIGNVAASVGYPAHGPGFSIADRDYFRKLAEADPGGLVASKPLVGRSFKEWVVVFARSYRQEDGRFAGVVYASVKLEHFAKTFDALKLGKNASIILVDADFTLYADSPKALDSKWIGRRIDSPSLVARFASGDWSSKTTLSTTDGILRRFAVRKLENHPFWLGVGLDVREELRPWRKQCLSALLVWCVFAVLTGMAGYAVHLGWREQQAALRKLVESERRFRFISENTEDVIWTVDAKTMKFNYVSPSVEKLRGYTQDEVLKQSLSEVTTAESARVVQGVLASALASVVPGKTRGITRVTRLDQPHKDGHVVPTETATTIVVDDQGQPFEFVGVTRNIEERLRTEEALRQSEESYRRIIENSHEFIAELDTEGHFVYASPNHETYFGYAPAELLGKPFMSFLEPADVPLANEALASLLELGQATARIRFLSKTGETFWLDSTGKLYTTSAGVSRILTFSRDVTDHQKSELVRQRLEEQLRVSQKMEAIGLLAGGVAHDFNNLLAIILSYTEFAMMGLSSTERRYDDLLGVKKAAERAAELTRQLLAFSRKQHWQPSILELKQLVTDFERMLQPLLGESITYERRFAFDSGYIFADRNQVEQILMNLVVNARDAMPKGGHLILEIDCVDLRDRPLALEAGVAPNDYVRLIVSDNGCGMDEATRAQIFEPFFTTKGRGKGTGLGLATVYGIIQKSGGAISVTSAPGVGTSLSVYFPRVAPPHTAATPSRSEPVSETAVGTETVLVVEDDDDLREVVRRHLVSAGYTVLVAADGLQALQLSALHPEPIALLLTDVIMPHMNGRAVAEELRKQRPYLRVLYMSGYTDNALEPHGILDESVHLLTKPFSTDDLLRSVRDRIDDGGTESVPD